KLEPTLLGALQLDLVRGERIEVPGVSGDTILEVPGRGYDGRPLEIAWCKDTSASQLSSPEATWIFTVFRRIRRALGQPFDLACPGLLTAEGTWQMKRKEIVPDVLAWWSFE